MLRFGQTLFGGFILRGIVSVAGTALAAASISASGVITKVAAVSAPAKASAQGKATKTRKAVPAPALADAHISGHAVGNFISSGLAAAIAEATGQGKFAAYGYSETHADATGVGKSVRQVRAYPFSAKAYATLTGDGFIYEFASPGPARAYARLIGTTFYVGHGLDTGHATIQATPTKIAGFKGVGLGEADGSGIGFFNIGGAGLAHGDAIVYPDAMVTSNGKRYFNGNVWANATATMTGEPISYQPQNGYAEATASGKCLHTHGAKGHGYADSEGTAIGYDSATGASPLAGIGEATAVNTASMKNAGGKTNGQAKAIGSMAKDAIVKHTNAMPIPGRAKALVQGKGYRTTIAKPVNGSSKALATGKSVKTRFNSGLASAYATIRITKINFIVWGGYIKADATTYANGLRIAEAGGLAQAIALATGYNQVNDLTPAPDDRTVVVVYVTREYVLPAQSRTVIV